MIFAHNHPSGSAKPSQADERMTKGLRSALNAVDIRLLDHFVIAGGRAVSIDEQRARKTAKSAAVTGQAQGSGTLCTTQPELPKDTRAATSGPGLADENSYFATVTSLSKRCSASWPAKVRRQSQVHGVRPERLEAISTHARNVMGQIVSDFRQSGTPWPLRQIPATSISNGSATSAGLYPISARSPKPVITSSRRLTLRGPAAAR